MTRAAGPPEGEAMATTITVTYHGLDTVEDRSYDLPEDSGRLLMDLDCADAYGIESELPDGFDMTRCPDMDLYAEYPV
jgi:hypothetical protein